MVVAAAAAIVAAESILALTPVAIKKTPLDPVSAVWSRILSTGILGYLLSSDKTLTASEWGTATALGITNLLHIVSSYESFRHLPAGQAMSLLYTYPFWNLIFNAVGTGERFSTKDYGFMSLAVVGSVLLNMDPGVAAPTTLGRKASTPWGILMGLIMALTESAMHVLLRIVGWRDPAKSVWVVNSSAASWLAGSLLIQKMVGEDGGAPIVGLTSGTLSDAAALTVFHGFSMFSGYWLRFFAVPRLSVMTYSILSYAGLLASYLFGLVILGERPGWLSVAGAALIVVSGILIQAFGTVGDEKVDKPPATTTGTP
jgi:drug/metabolite transporter (DMT)-like permease